LRNSPKNELQDRPLTVFDTPDLADRNPQRSETSVDIPTSAVQCSSVI